MDITDTGLDTALQEKIGLVKSYGERLREDSQSRANGGGLSAGEGELDDALDELASALREPSRRKAVASTGLPQALSTILKETRQQGTHDLWRNVGRVAANMAAECDDGRHALVDAGYPEQVMSCLSEPYASDTMAVQTLMASLLNLVIEGYSPALSALASWRYLALLASMSKSMLDSGSAGNTPVIEWIWKIIMAVLPADGPSPSGTFDLQVLQAFTSPLMPFLSQSPELLFYSSLLIEVASASQALETIMDIEDLPLAPFFDSPASGSKSTAMNILLEFIEEAVLPPSSGGDTGKDGVVGGEVEEIEDDEQDEELSPSDYNKLLGQAKASLIGGLTALCGNKEMRRYWGNDLWQTIWRWLSLRQREDLVVCALLCYANYATDADRVRELLIPESSSILPSISALLDSHPDVKVQHALLGLLRNISVPPTTSTLLSDAGLVGKVLNLHPWSEERDMLGSIQGGAIKFVSNLCKHDVKTCEDFIGAELGMKPLLALLKRTDDPALHFEGTRIFVNLIRTLSKQPDQRRTALERVINPEVIDHLCWMLRKADKHVILVLDSVLALTLIAFSGVNGATPMVNDALRVEHDEGDGEMRTTMDVLKNRMEQTGSDALIPEIKENVQTLLVKLQEI